MTVLDAYAVIAYLRGEPPAAEVADLLRGQPLLTSVNAAEVCDQMVGVFGADPDNIEADLALLCHVGLTVLPVSYELGMEAGHIRARLTIAIGRPSASPTVSPRRPHSRVIVRWRPPIRRWPRCYVPRAGKFIHCPTARADVPDTRR